MNQNENSEDQKEILYQGNHIPKGFKFIYIAFGLWASFYLVKYLLPDLLWWLKK